MAGALFWAGGALFWRVGWVGVSGGRCTLIMPFGKTLVAFDFDEKFTQSVAQITMLYHVSEDFLRLHFAVDQFKGMTWK